MEVQDLVLAAGCLECYGKNINERYLTFSVRHLSDTCTDFCLGIFMIVNETKLCETC